jgi:hypothetical protein
LGNCGGDLPGFFLRGERCNFKFIKIHFMPDKPVPDIEPKPALPPEKPSKPVIPDTPPSPSTPVIPDTPPSQEPVIKDLK